MLLLRQKKRFHEAKDAGPECLARQMREVLKTGRRYKPPSVQPTLLDKHGQTVDDSILALGEHFAHAERGERCVDVAVLQTRMAASGLHQLDREHLPSVPQLTRAFAGLAKRKAPGISKIPAEAFVCAPMQASAIHFPLLLKIYLREQYPMGWRGGQVAAIAKPQKCLAQASGWRSIMLLEASTKGIGRAVRQTLLQGFANVASPEQGGSRPKVTLEMPMMYVQEVLRILRRDYKPGGVLFIDGRNAFYATVRQLLQGNESYDTVHQLQELAQVIAPDEAAQTRFLSTMLGPGLLQQAGVPEPLRRMILTSMDRTWFTFGDHIFLTKTGTMPGAPLADLTFQFVFSSFLNRAKEALRDLHLTSQFFPSLSHEDPLPLPSWMDDLAVPLIAKDAHCLVDVARTAVEATAQCLCDIGIATNTDKGKTEVMLSFQGVGSKAAKKKWLVDEQARFTATMPDKSEATIHITPNYVHLGAVVVWSSSPVPDIRRRLALAMDAVQGVRRHILANPGFSWKEKMHMYSAMVMGRFLHAAGLWVLASREQQQAYQAAYMAIIRKAAWPVLGHSSQAVADDVLCHALGQFSPSVQRRLDLLRQLVWIARQPCPFFKKLLLNGEWLPAAVEAWHSSSPAVDVELPVGLEDFVATLQECSMQIKPAVRRLQHRYRKDIFALREVAVKDAKFFSQGDPPGWVFGVQKPPKASQDMFTCDCCGFVCATKSSLASSQPQAWHTGLAGSGGIRI